MKEANLSQETAEQVEQSKIDLSEISESLPNNENLLIQNHELMMSILNLERTFSNMEFLKQRAKVTEVQLQVALSWGLEKIFNIRCPDLLEKRKNFFQRLEEFFKKFGKWSSSNIKVDVDSVIKESKKEEDRSEQKNKINEVGDGIGKQKVKEQQKEAKIIKRSQEDQIKKIAFGFQPKKEDIPLTQCPEEEKTVKKGYEWSGSSFKFNSGNSNPYNESEYVHTDEFTQKEKANYAKKTLDDLTFHINWQKKGNFRFEESTRRMRKLYNDDYRKICGLEPFQDNLVHKIKFRVIKMGTIAFGIVKSEDKNGLFIDDRYCNCLKFISFFNGGGGKLNIDGTNIKSGRDLSLNPGQEFEMIFDTEKMHVIIKTTRCKSSIDISMDHYKGAVLYPFLEMKQQDTEIQFL